jgi:hypothetical protein
VEDNNNTTVTPRVTSVAALSSSTTQLIFDVLPQKSSDTIALAREILA